MVFFREVTFKQNFFNISSSIKDTSKGTPYMKDPSIDLLQIVDFNRQIQVILIDKKLLNRLLVDGWTFFR